MIRTPIQSFPMEFRRLVQTLLIPGQLQRTKRHKELVEKNKNEKGGVYLAIVDDGLFKFGYTEHLAARCRQHERTFRHFDLIYFIPSVVAKQCETRFKESVVVKDNRVSAVFGEKTETELIKLTPVSRVDQFTLMEAMHRSVCFTHKEANLPPPPPYSKAGDPTDCTFQILMDSNPDPELIKLWIASVDPPPATENPIQIEAYGHTRAQEYNIPYRWFLTCTAEDDSECIQLSDMFERFGDWYQETEGRPCYYKIRSFAKDLRRKHVMLPEFKWKGSERKPGLLFNTQRGLTHMALIMTAELRNHMLEVCSNEGFFRQRATGVVYSTLRDATNGLAIPYALQPFHVEHGVPHGPVVFLEHLFRKNPDYIKPGNYERLVRFVKKVSNSRFPWLKRDAVKYGFLNGVYDV
ncbi:hypothetical protein HDU81_002121 [Chytriomyces hyalinus]|nr:hypothetical protein HDU81_002121 [Chytriomyces hyalinus]